MLKDLKVVKFSKGEKVFEKVIGTVEVDEHGRFSADIYREYHKMCQTTYKCGHNEYLAIYIDEFKVNQPHEFSDFVKVEGLGC